MVRFVVMVKVKSFFTMFLCCAELRKPLTESKKKSNNENFDLNLLNASCGQFDVVLPVTELMTYFPEVRISVVIFGFR